MCQNRENGYTLSWSNMKNKKNDKTNSEIILKVDNKSDIVQVLSQFMHIFPNFLTRVEHIEPFAEKLAKYAEVYKIVELDSVEGFVAFYANDSLTKTGYITLIGVSPHLQNMGKGKLLLDYALHRMVQAQMHFCKLEVEKNNYNALQFYKRMGFSCYSNASTNSVYLIKELEQS